MTFNFDLVREKLFGGHLTQEQVDGINTMLSLYDDPVNGMTDARFQAYGFTTAWRETAQTMQPIEELGLGIGRPYGPLYYGRGLVQLTWLYNYNRFGILLKQPLVKNPELALDPKLAGQIMCMGMTKGFFTGKKLSDYFNTKTNDPVNARRIINGLDDAVPMSKIYPIFLTALKG